MRQILIPLTLVGLIQLSGCAGAIAFSAITIPTTAERASASSSEVPVAFTGLLKEFDKNTKYSIAGNNLVVRYERYQFFPNVKEMVPECNRKIQDVAKFEQFSYKEDTLRVKHGRNVLIGISNCEMSVTK